MDVMGQYCGKTAKDGANSKVYKLVEIYVAAKKVIQIQSLNTAWNSVIDRAKAGSGAEAVIDKGHR